MLFRVTILLLRQPVSHYLSHLQLSTKPLARLLKRNVTLRPTVPFLIFVLKRGTRIDARSAKPRFVLSSRITIHSFC